MDFGRAADFGEKKPTEAGRAETSSLSRLAGLLSRLLTLAWLPLPRVLLVLLAGIHRLAGSLILIVLLVGHRGLHFARSNIASDPKIALPWLDKVGTLTT